MKEHMLRIRSGLLSWPPSNANRSSRLSTITCTSVLCVCEYSAMEAEIIRSSMGATGMVPTISWGLGEGLKAPGTNTSAIGGKKLRDEDGCSPNWKEIDLSCAVAASPDHSGADRMPGLAGIGFCSNKGRSLPGLEEEEEETDETEETEEREEREEA